MGPYIEHTSGRPSINAPDPLPPRPRPQGEPFPVQVGDRVRFYDGLYTLNGGNRPQYNYLVRPGQVGTVTRIESISRSVVVVQWDHHHDGSEQRRGPQRIDRTCLELI